MNAARTAVEEKGPETGVKGLRIGIAAVQPGTGAVLAIYGGDDYLTDQFNNATQGTVQAGSTFKPFALAAALENDISLYDRFSGVNGATFTFPGFAPYRVNNFDGYNAGGSISLLRATQSSVNTAYVDLENEITPEAVVDSAIRAGIPGATAGLNAGPTTVLGTSSPHTLDMAAAYATFAARGLQANPYVIASVRNANGGLLYSKRPEVSRAYDADIASQVTYALTQVVKNGSGFAAQDLGRPAAGKTGTTNSNLSAWFVGYTPEISVAVSMAKSTESGGLKTLRGTGGLTRVTGGSFPARMWTAMVKAFLKDTPVQQFDGTTFNSGGYSGGGSSSSKSTKSPKATSTAKPTAVPTTNAPTPEPTVPPATSPAATP
jgi:membrane peptidoglycan carboxypeptidase